MNKRNNCHSENYRLHCLNNLHEVEYIKDEVSKLLLLDKLHLGEGKVHYLFSELIDQLCGYTDFNGPNNSLDKLKVKFNNLYNRIHQL